MAIIAHDEASEDGSVTINIRNRSHIQATLIAWGTFGGGTVQLEAKPKSSSTWTGLGSGLTADGFETVTLPPILDYRVTLSGSTTPTLSSAVSVE